MREIVIECDKALKSLFAVTHKQARAAINLMNDTVKEEEKEPLVNVMDGAQSHQHGPK